MGNKKGRKGKPTAPPPKSKKSKEGTSTQTTQADGCCIVCLACKINFARVHMLTEHVSIGKCAGTGTCQSATTKKKGIKKHKK